MGHLCQDREKKQYRVGFMTWKKFSEPGDLGDPGDGHGELAKL